MFVICTSAISLLTVSFCLVSCIKCESNTSRVDKSGSISANCTGDPDKISKEEENSRRKRLSGAEDYYSAYSTTTTASIDLAKFSEEFLECLKFEIEKGCYEILSNGSAFVKVYSKAFNDSEYYVDDGGGLYVCITAIPSTSVLKFDPALDIVSVVGLAISMVCIVLHMIMFALFPSLRNMPGYYVVSLCMSLLLSYSLMFLRMAIDEDQDCSCFGMGIMYCMLTAFFWMNVLSYDVWRSLRLATVKLRRAKNSWRRFGVYSLYAWGGPILIIATAIVIDKQTDVPTEYRLVFNQLTCWVKYRQALLMYFVTPMFLLIFCNLIFYVWCVVMIYSGTMKRVKDSFILITRFGVFLKLFVLMGLSWTFGSVAAATDLMLFWYLFAVTNCLQGALIFFSFSFGQKTKTVWKALLIRKQVSVCPPQVSLHNRNPV